MGEQDTIAIDTLSDMNLAKEARRVRTVLAPSGRAYGDEIFIVAFRKDPASMEALLEAVQEPAPRGIPPRVALLTNDFVFAERLARTAVESRRAAPTRVGGYLNLARLFVAQGRWSEAAIELGNAGRLDPDQAVLAEALLASLPWLAVP